MTEILMIVVLGFLGLVFGSFAGAQVWRLRAKQLRDDDAHLKRLKTKKQPSPDELEEKTYLESESKLRAKERSKLDVLLTDSTSKDRSRCLNCQHILAWYDLLPLASWLSTGGKCRYCHQSIGVYEPAAELGTLALFVGSYLLWPNQLTGWLDWSLFATWLVACVLMSILFIYDKKWFLLPDSINFSLMAVGGLFAAISLAGAGVAAETLASLAGAIAIMSGIYLLLYLYSKGAWIGFGDVKLGVGLGLLLGQWQLAFLALFLANLIGTLIVMPSLVTGKLDRHSQVPFGPLLIAGTIISVLCGQWIIDTFFKLSLTLYL